MNDASPGVTLSATYPSLAGKRVVITGGGSGIGAGLVEAFARQGAETIFVDIQEGREQGIGGAPGRHAGRHGVSPR